MTREDAAAAANSFFKQVQAMRVHFEVGMPIFAARFLFSLCEGASDRLMAVSVNSPSGSEIAQPLHNRRPPPVSRGGRPSAPLTPPVKTDPPRR